MSKTDQSIKVDHKTYDLLKKRSEFEGRWIKTIVKRAMEEYISKKGR